MSLDQGIEMVFNDYSIVHQEISLVYYAHTLAIMRWLLHVQVLYASVIQV